MTTVAQVSAALNIRKQLRNFGFTTLPCTAKKTPLFAFKRFTRAGGSALPTDEQLGAWEYEYPGANQLIITEGTKVGLVFVDADDRAQIGAIAASGQPVSPLTCETRQGEHQILRRSSTDERVVSRNGHLCYPDFSNVDWTYSIGADGKITFGVKGERRFGHTKIDVKADGAYCVLAGSMRKDGLPYTLKFNGQPIDPAVAFDPEWLKANVPVFNNAAWEATCAALKLKRQEMAAKARAERDAKFPTLRKGKAAWAAAAAAGPRIVGGLTHEPVMEWATEQPDQVNHDCWRGIATNIASVWGESGRARFHALSSGYTVKDGYCATETDRCYDDALESASTHGAMLYTTLCEHGYPGDVPSGFSSPAHFLRVHEEKKTADELYAFLMNDLVNVRSIDRVFSLSDRTTYEIHALRHEYSRGGAMARWEASLDRKSALGLTFDPANLETREGYLNTFDDREIVKPNGGNCECPPYFKVVMESLGQEEPGAAEWLTKLLAWQLRNIGRGWTVAVVMHGKGGVGKGLLSQYLRGLYGNYSYVARSKDIETKFNGWAKDKLTICGEEILESNSQIFSMSNNLKELITGEMVSFESKGVDPRAAKNHTRWFLFSNRDKPLHIEQDDRRFVVLHQTVAMDEAVGDLASAETKDPAAIQQLANFLHSIDLTGFSPTRIFHTEARRRLQAAGMNLAEMYFYDAWVTGERTLRAVYDDFLLYCEHHNVGKAAMEKWSAHAFGRCIPALAVKGQRTTGDRAKTITLPPLPGGRPDPVAEHRETPRRCTPQFYNAPPRQSSNVTRAMGATKES